MAAVGEPPRLSVNHVACCVTAQRSLAVGRKVELLALKVATDFIQAMASLDVIS